MSKPATLLWMDLEMTGLDPVEDRILEVACIATDWHLNSIAEFTAVVKVPEEIVKSRMVGDFWQKNTQSFYALVTQNPNGQPSATVERELLRFIDQHFEKKPPIYLAGNSIHQDRKFIDREWPALSRRLHYRMLDVSAWKIFYENLFHRYFTKPEAHRALDDIHGSIEEFKFYLQSLTPSLLRKFLPDLAPPMKKKTPPPPPKKKKKKSQKSTPAGNPNPSTTPTSPTTEKSPATEETA